jgi:hypothetical protein
LPRLEAGKHDHAPPANARRALAGTLGNADGQQTANGSEQRDRTPFVDEEDGRLAIGGLVEQSAELSLVQLREYEPMHQSSRCPASRTASFAT